LAVLYCKYGNFTKFNNSKDIFEYAKDSRKEFKYDIALCYNELGNINQARKWFEAAASMGYLPAKENLYTLLRGELDYTDVEARKIINDLQ
jgi:TPR repeat protein